MRDAFGVLDFGNKTWSTIDTALSGDRTFIEMSIALGLDRSRDFKHSDLSGVDFSNCDLRGFDFSGADLTFAYGINVIADSSTLIQGADVDGSIFLCLKFEQSVRAASADFEADYHRLKGAYWADQFNDMLDRIKRHGKSQVSQLMAMRLFDDTDNAVVRGDMLRVLGISGIDRDVYCSILLRGCSARSQRPVVLACIQILGSLFIDRKPVFETLVLLTKHKDDFIQKSALEAIGRSDRLRFIVDDIGKGIRNSSPIVRKAFLTIAGRWLSHYGQFFVDSDFLLKALSYGDRLTDKHIEHATSLARRADAESNEMRADFLIFLSRLQEIGLPARIYQEIRAEPRLYS